jgi:hypothetical protein
MHTAEPTTETRMPDVLEPAPAHLPATQQAQAPAMRQQPTAMDLLHMVTARNASVEEIGKFMDLLERQQDREAKQAYNRAFSAFKRDAQTIYKDGEAAFNGRDKETKEKVPVNYDFATLGHICENIISQMAQHQLSHRWTIDQAPGFVKLTCILTHEQGHSETASVSYPHDPSGAKNPLQAVNSAITYGERTSLLAVCGIAVKSQGDDDGAAGGGTGLPDGTTLADFWIGKVKAAPTDAEVVKVWDAGIVAIDKAGDQAAHKAFKNAVAQRRAEFLK